MFSDARSRKNDCPSTQPRTITYGDRSLNLRLLLYRNGYVFITMVLIGDVDMVPSPNIISDVNGEMPNDATASTD